MTNVDKIRDALVGGINLAKSAGWTRHQKDEVAEAEEALRLFDEMTSQASFKSQLLPLDVEEFIAAHLREDPVTIDQYIDVDDLRAWMSDHVRVPVELLKSAMCPECDGSGAYHDNMGGICQCRWCHEVGELLNASKGE